MWSRIGCPHRGDRLVERLGGRGGRAAEDDEIAAARHGAGADERDRRLLEDRVDGVHAGRDVRRTREPRVRRPSSSRDPEVIDERRSGASARSERGPVSPSPVGLAIVNEQYPSPSSPRPACERPFLTKIEQSHDLRHAAQVVEVPRVHDRRVAVAVLGLDRQVDARDSRRDTRTTGSTGIICSVQTNGWSSATSTTMSRDRRRAP